MFLECGLYSNCGWFSERESKININEIDIILTISCVSCTCMSGLDSNCALFSYRESKSNIYI